MGEFHAGFGLNTNHHIAETEGLIIGISSGAVVFAACEIAKRKEMKNKT